MLLYSWKVHQPILLSGVISEI